MAISKDEIEKYIFDPENPRDNENYEILLEDIIKSEEEYSILLTSEYFLKFISTIDVFRTKDFKSHLRKYKVEEIPLKTLKNKISKKTLDYRTEIKDKYTFLKKISQLHISSGWRIYDYLDLDKGLDNFLLNIKENNYPKKNSSLSGEYDKHYIIFSNCMKVAEFNFLNMSIFITLEENKDDFFDKIRENLEPIFLKKKEDLKILLETLEEDLRKESFQKNQEKLSPCCKVSNLNQVTIENFFSIKKMELLDLKDKKEVYIVGENGDGKSLFLQAVLIALVGVKEGDVFDLVKSQSEYALSVIDSEAKEYTQNSEQAYNYILAYGASRNNYCQMKEDETGYLTLFKGEYDLKSPIKWLQYLDYSEKSNKENILTVDEAKELLQHLLNSDIQIDISADKVTFTEKGSEVSFEQLSAGYKGVITIICDLIARLSEKQQVEQIADFQGVVLIDEVELHLHPKWQYSFMNKLREIFPLIQFIVTTHSPTVLLGAGMEAVYYQIYKEDGVVKISEQKDVKNDFLNDIQSDVFGFDVNDERINNPSEDDKKRQKRAKEAMLSLINTIKEEE